MCSYRDIMMPGGKLDSVRRNYSVSGLCLLDGVYGRIELSSMDGRYEMSRPLASPLVSNLK